VYNIANKDSLEHLGAIREHILRVKEEDVGKVPIVLVGNKADLVDKRQVSTGDGQQLAEQWNSRLFETSAKVRTNIDEVFEYIVRQIRGVGSGPEEKKKTKSKFLSKKNILKQLKCKTL
jgi:GTPase SAR1 family protein